MQFYDTVLKLKWLHSAERLSKVHWAVKA